ILLPRPVSNPNFQDALYCSFTVQSIDFNAVAADRIRQNNFVPSWLLTLENMERAASVPFIPSARQTLVRGLVHRVFDEMKRWAASLTTTTDCVSFMEIGEFAHLLSALPAQLDGLSETDRQFLQRMAQAAFLEVLQSPHVVGALSLPDLMPLGRK